MFFEREKVWTRTHCENCHISVRVELKNEGLPIQSFCSSECKKESKEKWENMPKGIQ